MGIRTIRDLPQHIFHYKPLLCLAQYPAELVAAQVVVCCKKLQPLQFQKPGKRMFQRVTCRLTEIHVSCSSLNGYVGLLPTYVSGTRWAATLGASGRLPQHIEDKLHKAVASKNSDVPCLIECCIQAYSLQLSGMQLLHV